MLASRTILLVCVAAAAVLLAGCASNTQTPSGTVSDGSGGEAIESTTETLEFSGSLTAPFPQGANPVTGEPIADGQEGVHYNVHALEIGTRDNRVGVLLEWEGQPGTPTSIPDLDLYVFNAEGQEVSGFGCATGAIPEECEVSDLPAGEYAVRVYLFAGGPTDYTLQLEVTEEMPAATA